MIVGAGLRRAGMMHTVFSLLVPLLSAELMIDPIIDEVLQGNGIPAASPAPEPLLVDPVEGNSAAKEVIARAGKGPNGTIIIPLDPGHRARALSHSGQMACFNDCPNGPGSVGSIVNDDYCDDGAASTAYCADPTGTQYPCAAGTTNWCPFGHDCADCGPRIVTPICTCPS